MKRILVDIMWALFPKPKQKWQRKAYLTAARKVAGWSEWLHYRAEEWCMELENPS